ncbi:ABC-2 type transport system permease protein [Algoriphagus iocasae]|uniref:ABC-2 type transport system permease protein n=1 Tax=Algoriphagus iocasae TaxID=1836499 RepID=A0A841MB79_9BACT|nr:M1 family aminopeptidase [Algoriphagus iocasae]MBB6324560.1 ABC-2 type transport system permease protein [Algoriphagus iocasae]
MLKSIYAYELKSLLKQPATYFYFLVFFGIALLSILGTGGFFDGIPETDKQLRLLNSAHEINFIFQYFNKFFLFLLPAIIGMVIYKDYRSNVHPILYSYPIKKSDYLLGKFLSSLTLVFLITLSIGIAFHLGESILGKENPMIGPTTYWGYANAYFIVVWPNMLAYGLLVFVVVASLRNIYAGFITLILLFFFQVAIDSLFEGTPVLFALLDPFGQNAVAYETRFWTISEQNTLQIPVLGLVLWNRLFWLILSFSLFGLFYKKFQLEQESFSLFPNVGKKKTVKNNSARPLQPIQPHTKVSTDFSFPIQLKAMLQLSGTDFRFIAKNRLFYLLALVGLFAMIFAMSRVTNLADMTFLPLTRIVLSVPMFFFSTLIMLLTFIYAGMLVHRSRMTKSNQLIDTTATSSWVLLGSKILALLYVQILLLCTMMLCGIGLQLYNGYHHFELDLYLFQLFFISFPTLIIWAALSLFVHNTIPNLYLGIFLLLLIWIAKDQIPQLGIETYLFRFNSAPQITYSDLNGFGHTLLGNFILNFYWLAFSALLIIVTYLFWERGYVYSLKERFQKAFHQLNRGISFFMLLFIVVFFCLGYIIYKEENNDFSAVANSDEILREFRFNFGKYKSAVQPKIVSAKLNIEIFPESNSFLASGHYLLINKTPERIDTLVIKSGYDEITQLSLSVPSTIVQKDENMQFEVHALENPMESGDSIQLHFEIKNKPNTLFYRNSTVLQNGTFLRTDILLRLGYFFDKEYRQPKDSLSKYSNFYSPDADLVAIETVISTNGSQRAIAPGTLLNHWTENSRNYFHYKTEQKVKFAFAFNSGLFSVSKSNHKGVSLEIYHDKDHTYNLKDMADGLKASLDYNTQFFGPYHYAEIRTVEFPLTEGTYASVMSNAIPTSEVRFVLRNEDAINKINLSFYVQAHELTHQWWGNQIVPAAALGAKMLTESITEYISLRIYEKEFGHEKALHFLSLQRQRYLKGRTKDGGKESPLTLVRTDQEYIAYGKGAIAFNTLQYYVGEEKLNKVLYDFLLEYRFRTDQYPTSLDLIAYLKSSLPHQFHYIIYDMMETVTFYDNKISDIKELPNNQLEISYSMQRMDSSPENEQDASEVFLTFGQYDADGNLLHLEKVKARTGENRTTFYKKEGATSILLDPFLHFIEMNIENNRKYIVN